MKKVTFWAACILVLSICACKKESVNPSITGTWSLVNISGSILTTSSNSFQTQTFLFYEDTLRYIDSNYHSGTNPPTTQIDSIPIAVKTELWTFGNDGTYTMVESFNQYQPYKNSYASYVDTISGGWDYLSNTIPNSTILFNGPPPGFFIQLINNNSLVIKKLTNDSLIFTNIGSNITVNSTVNSGTSATNLTYTFVKR